STAHLFCRSDRLPATVESPEPEAAIAAMLPALEGEPHLRACQYRAAADGTRAAGLSQASGLALLPRRPDGAAGVGIEAPAGCGGGEPRLGGRGQEGGEGAARGVAHAGAGALAGSGSGTSDAGLRRLGARYLSDGRRNGGGL